jgi:hypothetical protein
MAGYDAPRTAADLLDALARSGQPVTLPLSDPATGLPMTPIGAGQGEQ